MRTVLLGTNLPDSTIIKRLGPSSALLAPLTGEIRCWLSSARCATSLRRDITPLLAFQDGEAAPDTLQGVEPTARHTSRLNRCGFSRFAVLQRDDMDVEDIQVYAY